MMRLALGDKERRIFRLHLAYSVLEGVILGVLALNEFVFIKSLMGSNFQLGILFQFSTVVMVVTVLINEIVKRFRKKRLLRAVALITRLPLLFLLFFPSKSGEISALYHYLFLFIFLLFYSAQPVILPAINLFLKRNYKDGRFGKLYGYATTTNKVVMLAATFLFGLLLDYDNYAYVYIYPLIGALSITSVFLLSLMDDGTLNSYPVKTLGKSISDSLKSMLAIVKTNKPYRDFEFGFMFYGFAFMITVSVITIFMVEALELSYSGIAFYKNFYNTMAILMIPFFGRLMDKIDPRKFAIITFSSLMLHILFLAIAGYFPIKTEMFGIQIYYFVLVSFFFNGFFAATMSLLWAIGSSYFCKGEDAADYQSVHLTLVGSRAAFAPILGVAFYEIIGYSGVFFIAVSFLLLSVLIMYISMKRKRMTSITSL